MHGPRRNIDRGGLTSPQGVGSPQGHGREGDEADQSAGVLTWGGGHNQQGVLGRNFKKERYGQFGAWKHPLGVV